MHTLSRPNLSTRQIRCFAMLSSIAKRAARLRGRPSENRKPVMCIDTGITYSHAGAAAEATGGKVGNIRAVCNGGRERYKGQRWKYAA